MRLQLNRVAAGRRRSGRRREVGDAQRGEVNEENGSLKSPPGPRSRGRGGRAAAARRGCGRRGAVDEVLGGS